MGKIRKRIKKRIENSLNFGLMQYKQWFKHNIMKLLLITICHQVGGKITAMERALYQNSDIILSDESVQY